MGINNELALIFTKVYMAFIIILEKFLIIDLGEVVGDLSQMKEKALVVDIPEVGSPVEDNLETDVPAEDNLAEDSHMVVGNLEADILEADILVVDIPVEDSLAEDNLEADSYIESIPEAGNLVEDRLVEKEQCRALEE